MPASTQKDELGRRLQESPYWAITKAQAYLGRIPVPPSDLSEPPPLPQQPIQAKQTLSSIVVHTGSDLEQFAIENPENSTPYVLIGDNFPVIPSRDSPSSRCVPVTRRTAASHAPNPLIPAAGPRHTPHVTSAPSSDTRRPTASPRGPLSHKQTAHSRVDPTATPTPCAPREPMPAPPTARGARTHSNPPPLQVRPTYQSPPPTTQNQMPPAVGPFDQSSSPSSLDGLPNKAPSPSPLTQMANPACAPQPISLSDPMSPGPTSGLIQPDLMTAAREPEDTSNLRRNARNSRPNRSLHGFHVGVKKRARNSAVPSVNKAVQAALAEAGLSRTLSHDSAPPLPLSLVEHSALSAYCGLIAPPDPLSHRLAALPTDSSQGPAAGPPDA